MQIFQAMPFLPQSTYMNYLDFIDQLQIQWMSAETDHSAYEELLNYFASYLRDIAATISQVKSLAYTLVNVPQPPLKNIQVAPDISSVMNACKRTFDDIKRVESIMRGHTRGKESESSQSASRVQLSSGKKAAILGSKYPNIPLQSEKIGSEKELRTQSATHILENPFRTSQQTQQIPVHVEEESKSTRITHLPQQELEIDQVNRQAEQYHINIGNSQQIQTKIETMRASRNRDLKYFASSNDECLSLIKRIREELQSKKRK